MPGWLNGHWIIQIIIERRRGSTKGERKKLSYDSFHLTYYARRRPSFGRIIFHPLRSRRATRFHAKQRALTTRRWTNNSWFDENTRLDKRGV